MEKVEKILEVLKIMKETELWAAKYYDNCLLLCPENEKDFFSKLTAEENKHFNYLSAITTSFLKNPDHFELNEAFDTVSAKKVISLIKDGIRRIQNWDIKYEELLKIADELESSMIEHDYDKVLNIEQQEHLNLMNEIFKDTLRHRKLIEEKIQKASK